MRRGARRLSGCVCAVDARPGCAALQSDTVAALGQPQELHKDSAQRDGSHDVHQTEEAHGSLKRLRRVFASLNASVVVVIEGIRWTLAHEIHDEDRGKRQS